MPTPAQVANRTQATTPDRHYPATVTAVGPPLRVSLEPGGASTTALPMVGAAYTAGQRVLVLVTQAGNYILGRIA